MRSRAFTLIEVLASLLVLSLGMLSAIGLVVYGMQLAKLSVGKASGMATAMSVAIDHTPLLASGAFWTPSMGYAGISKGYINGFWVEREESSATAIAPGLVRSVVKVDVYETMRGNRICSYNEQLVRQTP
jgi:prepilin-type N-terminal cleavage/methylation domain-containing protein